MTAKCPICSTESDMTSEVPLYDCPIHGFHLALFNATTATGARETALSADCVEVSVAQIARLWSAIHPEAAAELERLEREAKERGDG